MANPINRLAKAHSISCLAWGSTALNMGPPTTCPPPPQLSSLPAISFLKLQIPTILPLLTASCFPTAKLFYDFQTWYMCFLWLRWQSQDLRITFCLQSWISVLLPQLYHHTSFNILWLPVLSTRLSYLRADASSIHFGVLKGMSCKKNLCWWKSMSPKYFRSSLKEMISYLPNANEEMWLLHNQFLCLVFFLFTISKCFSSLNLKNMVSTDFKH